MGYYLLHDPEAQRAVLFDSTSERALDHEAFMGDDARAEGESFMGWLHKVRVPTTDADFYFTSYGTADPTDPRCYTHSGLDRMIGLWREHCISDETETLNERGHVFRDALHAA